MLLERPRTAGSTGRWWWTTTLRCRAASSTASSHSAERLQLDLAQPAQTLASHAAWRSARRACRSHRARDELRRVGPVTAFRADAAARAGCPSRTSAWAGGSTSTGAPSRRSAAGNSAWWTRCRSATSSPVGAAYSNKDATEEAPAFLAGRPYLHASERAQETLVTAGARVKVAVVAEYYPRRRDPVLGVWAHRQALAARAAGAEVKVLVLERPVAAVVGAAPSLAAARRARRASRDSRVATSSTASRCATCASSPATATAPTRTGHSGRAGPLGKALDELHARVAARPDPRPLRAAGAAPRCRSRASTRCRSWSRCTAATCSGRCCRPTTRAPPSRPCSERPARCSATAARRSERVAELIGDRRAPARGPPGRRGARPRPAAQASPPDGRDARPRDPPQAPHRRDARLAVLRAGCPSWAGW